MPMRSRRAMDRKASCINVLFCLAVLVNLTALIAIITVGSKDIRHHAVISAQQQQLRGEMEAFQEYFLARAAATERRLYQQTIPEFWERHHRLNATLNETVFKLQDEDSRLESLSEGVAHKSADAEALAWRVPCLPHEHKNFSSMPGSWKCLKLFRDLKRPREAEKTCQSEGAQLAIIEDMATMNTVRRYLEEVVTDAHTIFVGGRWEGRSAGWRWRDGTAIDLDLWTPGEPHHSSLHRCAALWWLKRRESGAILDDNICDDDKSFLCEGI